MRLIALTGGPGAGKTTVITALQARGYECVADSARAIIQERVRQGLGPRPPAHEFADRILRRDTEQYRLKVGLAGPVFFDRCVVDALAMFDQLASASAERAQGLLDEYPYFRTAFIFPPWKEIYATDSERDQTFEEAVAVHGAAAAWYRRCGYDLVEVPRVTVQERCDFILRRIA